MEPRPGGEICGGTFDEVFRSLLFYLTKYPDYEPAPRGQRIKECLATTIVLADPRARIITNRARAANYGFATGEFLWYWQGRRDLAMMLYYNKRMDAYSDDGMTLNSAYGYRLRKKQEIYVPEKFGPPKLATQWEVCRKTLVEDPDSRRALMLINSPKDEFDAIVIGSKDVPCTVSMQFFIRENQLHLHVLMRSNDVIWGLTNDLFSFTLLQECMLLDLQRDQKFAGLELGTYYHTAGSMHLYERHYSLAEDILMEYRDEPPALMPEMAPIPSLEALDMLCGDEELLRMGKIGAIDVQRYERGGDAGGLGRLVEHLNGHRTRRDAERAQTSG